MGGARLVRNPLPRVLSLLRMQFFLAFLNFGMSIILARGLGPELRGHYAILTLWISLTAYVSLFGTHLYLSRRAADTCNNPRIIYAEAARVVLLMLPIGLALFLTTAFSITHFSTISIHISAWLVAACSLPFSVWNAMQMQIEIARGRTKVYTTSLLVAAVVQLGVVFLLWFADRTNISEYIAALVAGSIAASIVCHLLIIPKLPPKNFENPKGTLVTLYGARFDAFATLLWLAMSSSDRFFVSLVFPSHAFGVYVVALSVAQLQNMVSEAVALLFFGSAAGDSGKETCQKKYHTERLRQSVLINILTLIGLLIVGPLLVPIVFGEEYYSGVAVLYVLLPAFAIRAAMRPFEEFLKGKDLALRQTAAHVISLVVFLGGAVVFMHYESLMLTSACLLFGSLAGFLTVVVLVKQQLGVNLRVLIIPYWSDFQFLIQRISSFLETSTRND